LFTFEERYNSVNENAVKNMATIKRYKESYDMFPDFYLMF